MRTMSFQETWTYFCVTSVHHNAIKGDSLLSKAQSELEVLRIRGVIQVYGDRNRGLVCTVEIGQRSYAR